MTAGDAMKAAFNRLGYRHAKEGRKPDPPQDDPQREWYMIGYRAWKTHNS